MKVYGKWRYSWLLEFLASAVEELGDQPHKHLPLYPWGEAPLPTEEEGGGTQDLARHFGDEKLSCRCQGVHQ